MVLFVCIFAVQNAPTVMEFQPFHQLMLVRYRNPMTNSKSSVSMYTFGNKVSSAGAVFDSAASSQFEEVYPYPAATTPSAVYLPPELDLTEVAATEENVIPHGDEEEDTTPKLILEEEIPILVDDEEQEEEEPVVIVQDDQKTIVEEEDEEEIEEEEEPVVKKKPSKGGALFPVFFGKNGGSTIAIANSYSTGQGGTSRSVATAFGNQREATRKVKC